MAWNGHTAWQQGSPSVGAPVIMQDNVLNYKDYQAAGLGMLGQGHGSELLGYQQLANQQSYQTMEMRTVQQLVPEIEYVQMQVQVPQIEYVPVPIPAQQYIPEPPPERRERNIPEPPPVRRERAQPPPPAEEARVMAILI